MSARRNRNGQQKTERMREEESPIDNDKHSSVSVAVRDKNLAEYRQQEFVKLFTRY
jgi:hypothetical protein